ncbi:MAG: molybdopterin oxidoreductase [Alphaproteobacteria bacterium]|nr:MAG: molybdopterin oxidoreductase [Alphaproteobacteria bacterium]
MPDSAEPRSIIRTTCPRDCYDSCGIAVVTREGKVKVLGDPEHAVSRGALCGKCAIAYNGAWRDPEARLLHPLRRVGPKGEGRFERVSWDSCLAEMAARLQEIVARDGAETVWHTHYTGTCSVIAGGFPSRFFHRLGASEVEPDSICNMAGQVALDYLYGSASLGFDPRTAKDSACVMVWGANPSASAPHAHRYWLKETPGKVVVVDPVRHATAEAADLHLQPFPGTDAALAFAMLRVMRRDGLIDRAFLAANAIGWEEVERLLDPCTPAWGEAQTGVPAALIEEAARLYGSGPSLLWMGQGLQRQPRGGNVMRAVALLPAATGNLAKPGAGFLYLNGNGRRGIDGGYVDGAHLRRGPAKTASHMDLAEILADPLQARALFCWNINIAASNPDQAALHRALQRQDLLTVVVDLFQTDTADFADYVLPAASFLEFDDLVSGYFNLTISAQAKALEPMGEALPNQAIFRRLSAAMGFNEPELYEDDRSILDHLLAGTPFGGDFDALKRVGTATIFPEPVLQFADLVFPTPSGKIEIASDRAERDGHPRTALPLADPRPAAGRLRLLSPASPWLMNSSYGNDPGIAAKAGPERLTLHPDDAAARGLAEGDLAVVESDVGRLVLPVQVAAAVPPGAALAGKSRWPKIEATGVNGRANINALHKGRKADMGGSTSVHGVEVTVRRA